LLERLGVKVALGPARVARAIEEIGIGFLFAPAYHPAMKHAQPARLELKMRTVFNMLGPLTNPAGATAQVVGASSPWAAQRIAETLAELGLARGFVVHGSDGLDEITTTGPSLVIEIRDGRVLRREVVPAEFGVAPASLADLAGGEPEFNAGVAKSVLDGQAGPRRDIVLVNAAAALVAAGMAELFLEAMLRARDSIDSGAARAKLAQLAAFSQQ
jgi:anthranilate phosphoribosyltransferase